MVAYKNVRAPDGLAYYQKRTAWLPGQSVAVPDQQCPTCRTGTAHRPLNKQSIVSLSANIALKRRCVDRGKHSVDPLERLIWLPVEFELGRDEWYNQFDAWYCTCPTCHPERGE